MEEKGIGIYKTHIQNIEVGSSREGSEVGKGRYRQAGTWYTHPERGRRGRDIEGERCVKSRHMHAGQEEGRHEEVVGRENRRQREQNPVGRW